MTDGAGAVSVRKLLESDVPVWAGMRQALWPDSDPAELWREAERYLESGLPDVVEVFIAESAGVPVGVLELNLRSYAEGCSGGSVPYIEAWYVAEGWRGRGVGRALMSAAEGWASERGFHEIASDAELTNDRSHAAHRALGFEEADRIVCFRKEL